MAHKDNVMGNSQIYRRYAEQCRQLAKEMPDEHRSTLLRLAEAWIKVAEEEQSRKPLEQA
jgi:hypothetical protein